MSILTNPNDKLAEISDIHEVIRRKGGSATITDMMRELKISEARAKQLAEAAIKDNKVYRNPIGKETYSSRF